MAGAAYFLCLATALWAAILLTTSYRSSGARLIFWSAACFWGLSLSNLITIVDLYVVPQQDFYWARLVTGGASLVLLLYGLVWDAR